jgi:membrane protease YdiL (CAAX protease family)
MIMSSRALALFLGSLLLVSWAIQIAALAIVGDVQSDAMTPWLIGMMFVPCLWSVAYLTIFNRKAWKLVRFWPGNPLYLVLAALIPAAIAFATLAGTIQLGLGSSSFFTFSATGANVLHGPWLMGNSTQDSGFFTANVASTAIVFACLNGLAAIGEEFGWRGVLQVHIIERMGFLRGVAVLGFVWAIWHAPMNLAGYNYPDAPALGALVLFPIELIAVSFIMAWLTIRARSFWPAVLMHGSGNGIEEGVMSSLTVGARLSPLAAELLQVAITVGLALIFIVLSPRSQGSARPDNTLRSAWAV